MSDWARVARERFKWLERVAELRGVSVRTSSCEGGIKWGDEDGRRVIQIDVGADTAKWGRWLLDVAGADIGADIAACKWMAACWILLRELGIAEGASAAEADAFARRILAELTIDNLMTEQEAAALCERIARETISEGTEKLLH